MSIVYKDIKPEIKDGKNGAKLAKVLLEITPLRGMRVTEKDGKYNVQMPQGSYFKDGKIVYTKPIWAYNYEEVQKTVTDIIDNNGTGGSLNKLKTPVEGVVGYAVLDSALMWVDVTLTADGKLLFPTKEKQVDGDDGKKKMERDMVIPVKNDDPARELIINAITKACA